MRYVLITLRFLLVCLCTTLLWPTPPPARAQPANLLANPGFESSDMSWDLCGAASVVSAPSATPAMVYAGQRALRLTYAENGCGSPVFDPKAEASQAITVPADATEVTISFWYSRVGDPIWPLSLYLGEFDFIASVDTVNLAGWHLFRHTLVADDLERVRGQTVPLRLNVSFDVGDIALPPADQPGFYIDDLRVVTAIERTGESPRPAGLLSDGSQPIVYYDGQLGGIARMNADGSAARRIAAASLGELLGPVWSSRGDRVALRKPWLVPESTSDGQVNRAQITILYTLSAGGSGLREIYRTTGLPGRRPPVPTPGDPEVPALDVYIAAYDWSTDDSILALTICSDNRTFSGSISDAICWVELINASTGASLGKVEPAFRASWGAHNRILYEENDNYGAKPDGIYELDPSASPFSEQLLVPGTSVQLKPSFYTDSWPVWSPDTTQFVTLRDIDGFHYDEPGVFRTHKAIMLFRRDELIGRMLLLIDHGQSPGGLTWSPDGKFLLYHLFQGEAVDIWWLEVATGATGRLTSNGLSISPDWRARCANPACSDQVTLHMPMVLR